ncbi:unnamed protein product [Thlaspi arvense]|uniref:KIB1-4 beta-propeller domain-containing protein n=1 Tax=Thlaspi arvense TaxID=13288 RepID=A0AAU9RPP6_THLAR|nr:unnamed protein product [Thlaspi arvense]
MASYPDLDNEDWVVAIKLQGSKIKLYRPACPHGREPCFIDVKAMPRSIYTLSSIMYSKKDERFYVPTPGSEYLCSLDPNSKEKDPECIGLCTEDLTKHLDQDDINEVKLFCKTVHFVEAPSGEQFLVKWFFKYEDDFYKEITSRTRQFMVFRAEDHPLGKKKKQLVYTDDIGDLCIFLGHGEPYCLRASWHPGLKPNCIYFVGHNLGVYDITAKCCNIFYNEEVPLRSSEFPYWSHP